MEFILRTIAVIALFGFSMALNAAKSTVSEFELANGMKIIVKEDHRAPVIVSQVWYKVGSSHEYGGITGISHVLEHMMFKGTRKYRPGQFSRIIAANGGQENAFTGRDYTAYYQRLEKSRLRVSFSLEADRMRNLRLLEEEFKKELKVVLEERRMRVDDNPRSKTYEHFLAMVYSNGPYKNPVIGWPADIENLSVDDLKIWYQRWYAPNNATVVVVGDVRPGAVLALAKRHFGSLQPSELKPLKPRTEIEQQGEKRMRIKLPAKLPYLVMGYKTPNLMSADPDWEAYALEVMAGILDAGNSARLSTRLVRGKQLAVSAGAGYDLYSRLPSLFLLDATPVRGQKLADLEKALLEEVLDLQENPVDASELERVKAQVLANAIYEKDSGFYQAMELGTMETVGLGWRTLDQYVARVNAVTPQQIQQVAKKYLVSERLNVAYLEPQPLENKPQPVAVPAGGRHVQ